MLLCCAGQAACWAGQACCNLLCMCCSEWGAHKKVFSKLGYLCISLACILISFVLLFYAKDIFESYSYFLECPEGGSACMGISAVYRMSFVLVIFHLLLAVILAGSKCWDSEIGSVINDGCWMFHIIFIATLFVFTFWVSNEYINLYGGLSRFFSMFFLIFQGIWVLSIAYKLNEALVDYHNEVGSTFSMILLLSTTILLYLFDGVFLYYQFYWFGGCSSNIWIIIVHVVMFVIFTLLTIIQTRENASILTNAFVMTYTLYLSWSAMASTPDGEWNPFVHSNGNTISQIWLGLVFTSISVLSISVITKSGEEEGFRSNWAESDDENSLEEVELGTKRIPVEDSYIFPLSSATIYFHWVMILACCYYAMLLSNWGDPTVNNDKTNYFKANEFSVWMKLLGMGASYLIFTWSLVGPLVLPDRDWDV